MSVGLAIAPAAPLVGYSVYATATGLAAQKTRMMLDGVEVGRSCTPPAGQMAASFRVSAEPTTSTLIVQQLLSGVWTTVATLTFDVTGVDDGPPADPPPAGGSDWYSVPPDLIAAIPGGASSYTGSGSLGSFMAGIPAGGWGVLEFDGAHAESINIALRDGVTIIAGDGRTPELNGPLRLSGGVGARVFGLNQTWSGADSGGHMLKVDGGSPEYAYAEIHDAACYTLVRPGQAIRNARFHHLWIHDNPGVSSHDDGNQDHGFYCSAENPAQNVLIDHCLIEGMPRGRNVKVGGPSGGGAIGGITIRKCTLKDGQGPSNGQVSNGATGIRFENLVLIDSGASTNLTVGPSPGTGSTYANCAGDSVVGPNNANLRDAGGNLNNQSGPSLADYAAQGAARARSPGGMT